MKTYFILAIALACLPTKSFAFDGGAGVVTMSTAAGFTTMVVAGAALDKHENIDRAAEREKELQAELKPMQEKSDN